MSESFEKAVEAAAKAAYIEDNPGWDGAEAAWDDMGGSERSFERAEREIAARAPLEAALTHLTADDVPHLIRQAKAEAWGEGYRASDVAWVHAYSGHPVLEEEMCSGCRPSNPYAEESTNDHA